MRRWHCCNHGKGKGKGKCIIINISRVQWGHSCWMQLQYRQRPRLHPRAIAAHSARWISRAVPWGTMGCVEWHKRGIGSYEAAEGTPAAAVGVEVGDSMLQLLRPR